MGEGGRLRRVGDRKITAEAKVRHVVVWCIYKVLSAQAAPFALLRHEEPPSKRFGMVDNKFKTGVYYLFRR